MGLLKAYCWFVVLYLVCSYTHGVQDSIPFDVLSHLKNSTTLSDVMNKIKIKGSATQPTIPPYIDGVEVLQDARQSKDSCKVTNICTPVPIKKDVNVFYFPECIDLPQCVGSCCDNSHNCHPSETQPVKVPVNSWKYVGYVNGQPTFEPSTQYMVDMQKDIRCDCSLCLKPPTCDPTLQELIGCQCVCKNQATASTCVGNNKRWSAEKCACVCSLNQCLPGQTLSQNDCSCHGTASGSSTGRPDPVIDMGGRSRASSGRRVPRRLHFFRKTKTYRTLR